MSVVSMVPSWTESLLCWGVPVVGRTRYCIHPKTMVEAIPIIGGTKDTRWEKMASLNPSLLIVDKEENKKSVLKKASCPLHISHVDSLESMPEQISLMLESLKMVEGYEAFQKNLRVDKERWVRLLQSSPKDPMESLEKGIIEWIQKPSRPIKNIVYVIWKNPWMKVSRETFIGSILCFMGFENLVEVTEKKYPQFHMEDYEDDTLFLFSSEPYLFNTASEKTELLKLKKPSAIVDGELFSWFGVRSLNFLESLDRIGK